VFEAIVYVLRTGYQWKALPKRRFGSASAIHKRGGRPWRPVSLVVTGVNSHDCKRLDDVLSAIVLDARIRRIGDTSICARTRVTVEPSTFAPSRTTATSPTSLTVAQKPTSSNATRTRRPDGGWSRSSTVGSTASASCSVRYKKLERSFLALNRLAALIIAFREVPADVNII
jgi:transposase